MLCIGAAVAGCTPGNQPSQQPPNDRTTDAHDNGAAVFARACASCHALAAASSDAAIGPDLDQVGDAPSTIRRQIAHGGGPPQGPWMPAGLVSGRDARDVADYIADVARTPRPERAHRLGGEVPAPPPISATEGDDQ